MVESFNIYATLGSMKGFISGFIYLVLAIVILVVIVFVIIKFKRWRKLSIPLIEYIELKNGAVAIKTKLKCGWFGRHQKFFGLREYGEQEVVTSDKRRIPFVSSTDFQDINGKMGIKVVRKSDDPKILIPIANTTINNKELILDIAPADFRDAAVRLVELEHENLKSDWSKQAPIMVAIGLFLVAIVIGVYMIQQAGNFGTMVIDRSMEVHKSTVPANPPASTTAP